MPRPSHACYSSWSSTLRLPKSTFPPRIARSEHTALLQQCTGDLYSWQRRERPAEKTFVLHDGPPYANGPLHIGHAVNKILKDIICRFHLTQGKRIDFRPGWDCHGLPIELKALQSRQDGGNFFSGSDSVSNAVVVRRAARNLADRTVSSQSEGFQAWGIMADWSGAWKTMDAGYELKQLAVFREMVKQGLIYRHFKPVYWSPSSATALAEAELEYNEDHKSSAAFVRFPVVKLPSHLASIPGIKPTRLGAVIWTTTPWTIPANRAIAVHKDIEYAIVETSKHDQLLVAVSRVPHIEAALGTPTKVLVKSISGAELIEQTQYQGLDQVGSLDTSPIIHGDFVSDDSGSGLVHCAPGHGMEDYEVCNKHGISAFAPVDDEGRFTKAALSTVPNLLLGKDVLREGNTAVLELLRQSGWLIQTHAMRHKYPYDWRTKQPVIVRATEQWFANVGQLKQSALSALQHVRFIPESGRARLESFVNGRTEWCISRQRAWGVPIPVLYEVPSGAPVLTPESISHIMGVIETRGIDRWWTDPADDSTWILPELREQTGKSYRRGKETMDVWFDSGTSWTQLMDNSAKTNSSLADVYSEGTDQHRGWFQSSLLTYIASQSLDPSKGSPKAPFKTLITHGFTLDQEGRKMSKSIGNVISPEQIMDGSLLPPMKVKKKGLQNQATNAAPVYDAMGPDALRLWVASSDYTRDIVVGTPVLKSVNQSLHKLRVTLKLLLGTLHDFAPSRSILPYDSLLMADKFALLQLTAVNQQVLTSLTQYEFHRSINSLSRYLSNDLSAFYVETIKDRVYADSPNSPSRLAAQTTLFHIYTHLLGMLSPFTPLLVEEAWQHTPAALKDSMPHPLHALYPVPDPSWHNKSLAQDLPTLLAANAAVKTAQEHARAEKKIGSSLQSDVVLALPPSTLAFFQSYESDLAALFVVSSVRLVDVAWEPTSSPSAANESWSYAAPFDLALDGESKKSATAYVLPPEMGKCPRCWRYVAPSPEALCGRCEEVVGELSEDGGREAEKISSG